MGKQLREELDLAGGRDKILVLTADGSFCNRTYCGDVPDRSVLLARARKDAKLCFQAPPNTKRFYALESLLPSKSAKTSPGSGRRRRSSTEEGVARLQTPCAGTSLVSAKMRPEPQFDCAWQQMRTEETLWNREQ